MASHGGAKITEGNWNQITVLLTKQQFRLHVFAYGYLYTQLRINYDLSRLQISICANSEFEKQSHHGKETIGATKIIIVIKDNLILYNFMHL